jgi:hypothetical protein
MAEAILESCRTHKNFLTASAHVMNLDDCRDVIRGEVEVDGHKICLTWKKCAPGIYLCKSVFGDRYVRDATKAIVGPHCVVRAITGFTVPFNLPFFSGKQSSGAR